jgi:hypothetical protein
MTYLTHRLFAHTAALAAALTLTATLSGTGLAAAGDPSQWGISGDPSQWGTAPVTTTARKVNEYEGQHRKVNEYEGQHRVAAQGKDPEVPVSPN